MLWNDFRKAFFSRGPWDELFHVRNHFDRLLSGITDNSDRDFPAVNLWSNPEEAVITAELPGVSEKDLDISVQGRHVTLRGGRTPETLKNDELYHRQERSHGNFVRTLKLPFEVNPGEVKAKLQKGILIVNLPRAEETKPKKIQVKMA